MNRNWLHAFESTALGRLLKPFYDWIFFIGGWILTERAFQLTNELWPTETSIFLGPSFFVLLCVLSIRSFWRFFLKPFKAALNGEDDCGNPILESEKREN